MSAGEDLARALESSWRAAGLDVRIAWDAARSYFVYSGPDAARAVELVYGIVDGARSGPSYPKETR